MLDFIFYGAVGFLLVIVLWQLALRFFEPRKSIVAALALFAIVMPPSLAFAADFSDAGPVINFVASHLPQPYSTWFVTAIAILGMMSVVSSWFRGIVRPPVSTAPKWWIIAYRIMSLPAMDFGWARNVVLPGQPKAVQESMALVAKLAASGPATAVVHQAD